MPVTVDGNNTPTAGGVGYGDGAELAFTAAGSAGQVLQSNGASAPTWGAVPAVNLATGVTGTLPIANGGTGTTSTTFVNLASNVTGTLPVGNGGTGATTLTGVLRGNGTSAFTAGNVSLTSEVTGTLPIANGGTGATTLAGANLPVTTANNTFTGTQTFTGTSSVLAMVLNDAAETVTVSATAATGTINYDITTQSVLFYTSNSSNNFTVNLRASSGTSLNSALATGQSVTVAFLVTNGSPAYYNTSVQVDGTTSGVTTRWQGGSAPTSGNASSVDIYSYTVIKTANATFSVFAAQTRFA
jgi:hypothetical protein